MGEWLVRELLRPALKKDGRTLKLSMAVGEASGLFVHDRPYCRWASHLAAPENEEIVEKALIVSSSQ